MNVVWSSIKVAIQARTGSTRYPGKILEPFWVDETILDVMLDTICSVVPDESIVIATSSLERDDILATKYARRAAVVRGDENDVLGRFITVLDETGARGLVRVCADNPFLLAEGLRQLLARAASEDSDYIGFLVAGTPSILTHCGLFAEYAGAEALRRAASLCGDMGIREHVTKFIYENPGSFALSWIRDFNAYPGLESLRLTVDRRSDFLIAQRLFAHLRQRGREIELDAIMEAVKGDSVMLREMKENILLNAK